MEPILISVKYKLNFHIDDLIKKNGLWEHEDLDASMSNEVYLMVRDNFEEIRNTLYDLSQYAMFPFHLNGKYYEMDASFFKKVTDEKYTFDTCKNFFIASVSTHYLLTLLINDAEEAGYKITYINREEKLIEMRKGNINEKRRHI